MRPPNEIEQKAAKAFFARGHFAGIMWTLDALQEMLEHIKEEEINAEALDSFITEIRMETANHPRFNEYRLE